MPADGVVSRTDLACLAGVRLALTAVAMWGAPGIAQRPVSPSTSARDSAVIAAGAKAALDRYEFVAAAWWSPRATPTVLRPRLGGGGTCGASPGDPPCLLGRRAPCPTGSSASAGTPSNTGYPCGVTHRVDEVIAARESMLATLERAATRIPGDPWIAGQLTYYLVQARERDRGIAAVDRCRADGAWCELLRGYVFQGAGDWRGAESAFDEAVRRLPVTDRCGWSDVSLLLPDSARSVYAAMPCGSPARDRFESRLWWLADPSWLTPGNDRRAEHYARLVERVIQRDWRTGIDSGPDWARAGITYQVTADHSRLPVTSDSALVITGRNDSYWIEERVFRGREELERFTPERRALFRLQYTIVGQRRPNEACARGEKGFWENRVSSGPQVPCARFATNAARYHFVPSIAPITDPFSAAPESWSLTIGPPPGLAGISTPILASEPLPLPPERYTPNYAGVVSSLVDWQLAYLRRGDSALLVAATDLARDSAFASLLRTEARSVAATWNAGLIAFARLDTISGLPRDTLVERTEGPASRRWTVTMRAPWAPLVAGLEIIVPADSSTAESFRALRPGVLGRVRLATAPASESSADLALSDVVLYEPDPVRGVPTTTGGSGGLVARMLGTTRLPLSSTVGIGWEVYGLSPGDTTVVTVTVRSLEVQRGVLSRMLGPLGGGDGAVASQLQWRDVAPPTVPGAEPGWVRGVDLNIGSLREGRYVVEVRARRGVNEAPATAARIFTVERTR